jgi:hypothetical protein
MSATDTEIKRVKNLRSIAQVTLRKHLAEIMYMMLYTLSTSQIKISNISLVIEKIQRIVGKNWTVVWFDGTGWGAEESFTIFIYDRMGNWLTQVNKLNIEFSLDDSNCITSSKVSPAMRDTTSSFYYDAATSGMSLQDYVNSNYI